MAKLNLNTLAKNVAKREGGKNQVNIAQIKEVIRHTLDVLSVEKPSAVLAVLEDRQAF